MTVFQRSDIYPFLRISIFEQPCKTGGGTDENAESEKLKH